MNGVFIALGANLGNPAETFARGLSKLAQDGIMTIATSSLWRSPAWPPGSSAPDYVNAVARVETTLSPHELLAALHRVEAVHGRQRSVRNAPRTLDLDLIAYDSRMRDEAGITVPHPRLRDRPFVLLPLYEVAPEFRHPLTGEGINVMLARLDSSDVLAHRRVGPMLAFRNDSH